ncbi:MAG: Trk system potassium transporter TrkA [Acidimicrobiales bacterium]|nr:Trk system potassium transporter TrkA [Acidimicrobiales bacterium]
MYVIVVGAGEVGSYVAERLSREGHDVAVVEADPDRFHQVDRELDVLMVLGSGTHPRVLADAGLSKADLLVAVTTSDEVNLIASLLAKQSGVPRTIVRIESPELRSRDAAALRASSGADLVIDPDEETAQEILELLEFPGASEVAILGGGEVIVLGARVPASAPLAGQSLSAIGAQYEPEWDFIVGSISRGGETIIPRGDVVIEPDDLLRLVVKRRARREIAKLLGINRDAPHRVLLLGGGHTASVLAQRLCRRGVDVTIVERQPDRARVLAEQLERALVLQGEITDADLLEEAGVRTFDAVVALTGEDDANILACLYAKAAGAKETVAVVHRLALLDLLGQAGVDVALSPRTATANGVLRFVRGDVAAVATFLRGEAEVLEFEVAPGSRAEGNTLASLQLPKTVLVAAIVRDGKPQIARGRSSFRARDHVVVFAMPQAVDGVARLFG